MPHKETGMQCVKHATFATQKNIYVDGTLLRQLPRHPVRQRVRRMSGKSVSHVFPPFLLLPFLLLFSTGSLLASEEKLPLWELGIGGGVLSLPQYMGSNERYTFPFAFPYLIYRGDNLRIDRSGLRGRLFDIDRLSLDLSLSGGLPVRNSNTARQGMPKIYLTGELGPRLNWVISESERISWSMHLASRAAINIRGTYTGWVTEPFIRYNFRDAIGDEGMFRLRFELGALYGSKQYLDTYYTVAPLYATATRPAYQARSGIHSLYVKSRIQYRFNRDIELFTSLQARTLAIGVVRDSPLVKNRSYLSAMLGVIWTFSVSDEMVMHDEAAMGG